MTERKVLGRKSQMFLHSVIPVLNTHDELIKQKLKRGKFLFTITGIMKLIGILFLLISVLIFISNSKCNTTLDWYPFLFPCVLGIHTLVTFSLYLIFSLGLIINNPGTWVNIDISVNFCLSVASIVALVLSLTSCSTTTLLQRMPMILGLCGDGILIVSCAALFLMYRYKEDSDEMQYNAPRPINSRNSIFV